MWWILLLVLMFPITTWAETVPLKLIWDRPTVWEDGTTLNPEDIQGYDIGIGTTSGEYNEIINWDASREYSRKYEMQPGDTIVFAVRTVPVEGKTSVWSDEARYTLPDTADDGDPSEEKTAGAPVNVAVSRDNVPLLDRREVILTGPSDRDIDTIEVNRLAYVDRTDGGSRIQTFPTYLNGAILIAGYNNAKQEFPNSDQLTLEFEQNVTLYVAIDVCNGATLPWLNGFTRETDMIQLGYNQCKEFELWSINLNVNEQITLGGNGCSNTVDCSSYFMIAKRR